MVQDTSWIAIVDDDPSVLRSLSRTLRTRAFDTRIFSSALEFLEALPRGPPACLILDVQMPGMTGIELHHHLLKAGVHIPTIIITARDDRMRELSLVPGIVAVLSKPLRNPILFDALAAALGPAKKRPCDEP